MAEDVVIVMGTSDRKFVRVVDGIIRALEELVAELKVSKDSMIKGGKLIFDSDGLVQELTDLAVEVDNAQLDTYRESYPSGKING